MLLTENRSQENAVPVREAPDSVQQVVINALGEFLASPPDGTPAEVVEALTLMGGNPLDPLPPRLFFESGRAIACGHLHHGREGDDPLREPAFETLTGYARAEVLGQERVHPVEQRDARVSVYQQLWRTIQRKETWTGTLVNRTKGGVDYLAELIISPVLDAAGDLRYFLGMHRDVTKMHELEVALRQQKARIETVLDAAPVIVVLLDSNGRIILDNQEYKKLLGDLRGKRALAMSARRAVSEQLGFDAWSAPARRARLQGRRGQHRDPGQHRPALVRLLRHPGRGVRLPARPNLFRSQAPGDQRLLLLANEVTARRREIERAHLENLRARLAEQQLDAGHARGAGGGHLPDPGAAQCHPRRSSMCKDGSGNPTRSPDMLDQITPPARRRSRP
jgi:nitrogen fixation regulatory protein